MYFASRTHSQLSQFVAELRKTTFARGDEPPDPALSAAPTTASASGTPSATPATRPIRLIPLGSRQNLCINDEVRRRSGGSNEALGDACLELQKATDKTKRCPFLPPSGEPARLNTFRDRALVSLGTVFQMSGGAEYVGLIGIVGQAVVQDIEDIESLGRRTKTCPYYGSRKAVRSAEIVTVCRVSVQKATRADACLWPCSFHTTCS